ncbi:MAG: hypothetical protein ACYS0D_11965 [Planctomycetota bacterium]
MVFGKDDGIAVQLADVVNGIGGFVINGHGIDGTVSDAGDVNGDGLSDVIVGVGQDGASYVVFGKADGAPVEAIDVAGGDGGFVINGDPYDAAGASVSGAGDVNGDGLADVIVGALFADPAGIENAGRSYVVYGKADGTPVSLSDVEGGVGGFAIDGVDAFDEAGRVSGAGDVNGDGLSDVLIGAASANVAAGESYVVFSPFSLCPWDLDGDGTVGTADLLHLIASFGPCGDECPADFNEDGVVSAADLLELLSNFGPCPGSACVWDVNGDGVVDQDDLRQVLDSFGPCDGCPEDVNGDGVVDGQDAAAVAQHFGACP